MLARSHRGARALPLPASILSRICSVGLGAEQESVGLLYPAAGARRAVGVMVLLLTAVLLLRPVPLSNVAPAMVISLISLSYVRKTDCCFLLAFLAAIILIGIASTWGTIVGALLISPMW